MGFHDVSIHVLYTKRKLYTHPVFCIKPTAVFDLYFCVRWDLCFVSEDSDGSNCLTMQDFAVSPWRYWRFRSSWMWCCVGTWKVPDFLRNRSVFIFRMRLLGPEDDGIVIRKSIWNSSPQLRRHNLDDVDHRLFRCWAWKCEVAFPSDEPKIYSLYSLG